MKTPVVLAAALTLLSLPAAAQSSAPPPLKAAAPRDGAHDFDFEFGNWKAHLSRRLHPFTGSTTWVEYDGTNVVRQIWGGKGNLAELEVAGSQGPIEGLSLRLYDPQTHQWSIRWANSVDGELGQAMVGAFDGKGGGEFYDQETFNGRSIFVRFVFSGISDHGFRIEQAFSDDGGKTWEVNWISTFSR